MRRSRVQIQKDFDRILKRIQSYKSDNINGYLSSKGVLDILADQHKLRKMFKCAVVSCNRANQALYSPKGAFVGWG